MISLFLIGAIAIAVPSLDMSAGCRPQSAVMGEIGNFTTCMKDEEEARKKLAKEWTTYPASTRAECAGDRASLLNSYVELMTCIEMQAWKTDLGKLTAAGVDGGAMSGAGGGSPPTPGQLGGSTLLHPLGGSPVVHIH
jgi:hypothetical protein